MTGFMCDLLWSDPLEDELAKKHEFTRNAERECSIKFGYVPIKKILKDNNMISVIRAH